MANKNVFATARQLPAVDTTNLAGGSAYALSDKAALAQMVMTGTFNQTFYASANDLLAEAKALAFKVEPIFLAKLAVYARQSGYMKDMPAFLTAVLATRDVALLTQVFNRVIDNGKMLRNFVQMIRSGQVGRKSLGTRPKKLVAQWLMDANDARLLAASVGNAPSLKDVIRLAHPHAANEGREAFLGYLVGRDVNYEALPDVVKALEAFRKGDSTVLPDVPFELLTSMNLSTGDWVNIAKNASWTQTRMNLNTFQRHGVFESAGMVKLIADRLADETLVAKSRVFPYQLLAAYLNATEVPVAVRNALQNAMELSAFNVPEFEGGVAMLVDTSGSMQSPVTGHRDGATSKVRCIDVAGLMASVVLRRNPDALVVPFDTRVHKADLNGFDSIMTNAQKLARYGGGGTNCGSALQHLNAVKANAKTVIYVSDNESWVNSGRYPRSEANEVMEAWAVYRRRVPGAKLVCIDVTPNTTTQAKDGSDVLNIGGFSDAVFTVIDQFAKGSLGGKHWVDEIEKVTL